MEGRQDLNSAQEAALAVSSRWSPQDAGLWRAGWPVSSGEGGGHPGSAHADTAGVRRRDAVSARSRSAG